MDLAAPLSATDIPSVLPPTVVTFALVVSGTVDTFDREAYAKSLGELLKVTRAHISLEVAAASVRVTAAIHANSEVNAAALVGTLRALTPAAASSSLGVQVLSVEQTVVCQPESSGSDGCLQSSPTPPTTIPVLSLPLAPPPPPIEDEREDKVNTEGITI